MATAPGYRTHPEHHIRETRVTGRVSIAIDDTIVADSKDVVRVDEEGCPQRYYFPRTDVRMDLLERSPSVTRCPFKGSATYFTLDLFGKKFTDASWSYEEPYDEHAGLRGRIAFYLEKFPELELRMRA
jgi:uncharacterized protein (DUF427 family)